MSVAGAWHLAWRYVARHRARVADQVDLHPGASLTQRPLLERGARLRALE